MYYKGKPGYFVWSRVGLGGATFQMDIGRAHAGSRRPCHYGKSSKSRGTFDHMY